MSPYLERYQAILEGRSYARYLLARSLEANQDDDLSLAKMWQAHGQMMERYRELVIDNSIPRVVENSLLDLKRKIGKELLKACCFCEHDCRVGRTIGTRGRCGVLEPRVASHFVHWGEEEPLVPSYTIFFAGCNIQCAFCQNYEISTHPDRGRKVPVEETALHIERLVAGAVGVERSAPDREAKIRNVNWVGGDPTPDIPYILEVLGHMGANIAQVWNSNMYLSEKAMALLDGTIDIYLTDLKYGNDSCALRLSGTRDYMRIVTRNHLVACHSRRGRSSVT